MHFKKRKTHTIKENGGLQKPPFFDALTLGEKGVIIKEVRNN